MKMKHLLISILIFGILIFEFNMVYATDNSGDTDPFGTVFGGAKNFVSAGNEENTINIDEGRTQNASSVIYNVFFSIGVVVAVIMSSVLGIKFMIGSVEEKAQIKESLVPFIIGCVVVFGAFGIWKIVVTIGNSITG